MKQEQFERDFLFIFGGIQDICGIQELDNYEKNLSNQGARVIAICHITYC